MVIWQIICCVGWNRNVFGLVGLFWISLEFRITLNNLSFKVIEELNEFEKGYLPPENHEEKLKVNLMPHKCIVYTLFSRVNDMFNYRI